MKKVAIAAAAALCLCAPATAAAPAFGPKPAETGAQLVTRVKAALAAPGCNTKLKALFFTGFGAIPPAACDYLRREFGKFEDPAAKVYGTAAVVDGYIAGKTDNWGEGVFVLERDRKFHLVFAEEGSFIQSTKTLFQEPFETSFRIGIHALRTGNCDEFLRVAHSTLGIGAGKRADVCARFKTNSLAKLLRAEPRATIKRLSGTSDYGFYGIQFKRAFYTVVMVQQPPSVKTYATQQYAFVAGYPATSHCRGRRDTVKSRRPRQRREMADYSVCKLDDVEASHGGGFKGVRGPLNGTAFGIGVVTMPANYAGYPEHDHSDDGQEEVYFLLGGSGELEIEGERVALEPDTFIRVGSGTKRKVLAGPDGIRFMAIGAPEGSYKT